MRYQIEYSPDAEEHMEALSARQRALIMDAVEKQLSYEAKPFGALGTKNSKPESLLRYCIRARTDCGHSCYRD